MEKIVLKVEGMSCEHCKMSVEKGLAAIGVKAEVNLEAHTVTIEHDAKKVSEKQIITEIEDLGYEVAL